MCACDSNDLNDQNKSVDLFIRLVTTVTKTSRTKVYSFPSLNSLHTQDELHVSIVPEYMCDTACMLLVVIMTINVCALLHTDFSPNTRF